MNRSRSLAVVALLITVLLCISGFAQSDRGSITGTVTDASGARVPNVKITATNQSTGEVRTAESSSDGNYLLPELQAAPWKLKVESQGFRTTETPVIQVAVQVTRKADFTLQVGSASESISVSAEAPVIQTENATAQTNVSERQVKELPLQVGAESG